MWEEEIGGNDYVSVLEVRRSEIFETSTGELINVTRNKPPELSKLLTLWRQSTIQSYSASDKSVRLGVKQPPPQPPHRGRGP